ncbi:MAG: hypothetical protein EU548_02925, partial [Promethearchaeota archaeon]
KIPRLVCSPQSWYFWSWNPHDDTLRMTLLYTPATRFFRGFHDQKYQDWGEHTIRYAIFGHQGDFKKTDHLAKRFNQRIRSFYIRNDLSSVSKEDISLFRVSNEQLGILAVKKPEDQDGILIRVYERYGKSLDADVIFNSEIQSVKEVNGLEEFQSDIKFSDNKFSIKMEANEIRSYIVEMKDSKKAYHLKQEPLKLDYNHRLIGDKDKKEVIFPAKLTPARLDSGLKTYILAVDKELNALQCKGQKISIPEGYNTLSFLIASKEDCVASFKWLNDKKIQIKEEKHHVSAMSEFIGQWDTRIWKRKPKRHLKYKRDYIWLNKCTGVKPGYIKRDRLEWFATHTYKMGKVQPYHYGYVFTIDLEIPKDAKSLILPEDSRIYIMAITASLQEIKIENNQILRDKYDF